MNREQLLHQNERLGGGSRGGMTDSRSQVGSGLAREGSDAGPGLVAAPTAQAKWDERFVTLAGHVGEWSKDPSTKTGCAIVRPDRTIASVGYNGFPRGVVDDDARLADRPTKYAMTVHAEANAVLAAREALHGCTAYVHPWPPCASCAAMLIQAGIVRVLAPEPTAEQRERWGESFDHAMTMLAEAGVVVDLTGAEGC